MSKNEKSEFLKKLVKMDREEIEKKLNENVKRVKKIYPVVKLKRSSENDDENDGK